MEDKIKTMMSSFGALKEAIQDMRSRVNLMEAAVESSESASADLMAALIKEKNAERADFEAAINKTKEEAERELKDAVAKAKEEAVKEMDAEILKDKQEVQKQLDSLKQLSAVLSQTQSKAPSEHLSVDTYVAPSHASQAHEPSEVESTTSFETICDELLRHTKNYLRSLNVEYRVDINAVSK
jgi:chromosome segregation ATPase